MSDGQPPITVSRDALRADLAEMELRLMNAIRTELANKASVADVILLQAQAAAFARGEFTVAQLRSIDARVEEVAADKGDRAWSRWSQLTAILGTSVVTASILLAAALAHGGLG